jgi:hypothetical protein
MRKLLFMSLVIMVFGSANAQVAENSELFQTIKTQDSLLFNIGFNTCDLAIFESLLHEDFEMYHDKSGILYSKADFIKVFREGLCKSPDTYQSRRELVPDSMEVFELKNQGETYAALQNGHHRFYEKVTGKPETAGNIARFSHLWLLVDNQWKLARSISYDHLMPEN